MSLSGPSLGQPRPITAPIAKTGPEKIPLPCLSFENVFSQYDDGRFGLKGFNLEVPARRVTVLAGVSGSGKSTALNILMGFAPLSQGCVYVQGEKMTDFRALARHTAWCSQHPYLFHSALMDNIRFASPDATEEEVLHAARHAGVNAFTGSGSQGLKRVLGAEGHGLSGGQAQRVALARALLKLSSVRPSTQSKTGTEKPSLLLLDEPTAHLDVQAERAFLTYLEDKAQGHTVLIASHRPAMLDLAHKIAWLEDGIVMKTEEKQAK